ncbi:MAG: primosomal protein N' [Lachnospiraceae bacterium]|nr:primosomal protein N' [Lachnospiraceae bacterium]
MYAKVIVDISHEKLDRPFTYIVPSKLLGVIEEGDRVQIPFGAGNKIISGYVIELTDNSEYDISKLKEIIDLEPKSVRADATLIKLASFIRKTYGSTQIQALKTVMPVKKTVKREVNKRVISRLDSQGLYSVLEQAEKKHKNAQARLIRELISYHDISYSFITGKMNVSAQAIAALEKNDVVSITCEEVYRNPIKIDHVEDVELNLSDEQRKIVDDVNSDIEAGIRNTYLIYGITGSGKTEVYMHLIEDCLKRDKQAIMLIPEIALTYQNLTRFYARFGDSVSVIHSKMTQGERYDQFLKVKEGKVKIMIGPRSALFTPFENLGLIIIDEEHEGSYKAENMPKYHAREVAGKLAELTGASLILGSATPSIDSYYRAKNGEYKLYKLTQRLTGNTLPTVYVEDMREELKEGNKSVFSRHLHKLIEDRLEKHDQIMLFLNRRGVSGFVSCRECGEVVKCPHCDISLSYHRDGNLKCHYCGYERPFSSKCDKCGAEKVRGFRAGTQMIEDFVKKEFPYALVLRMDADSTKKQEDYETILSRFANREADILIGTQMIVKGHDFKGVTLVGVIAADMALNAEDYRAGERAFQQLVQASGRAGRGDNPGEVVIQTYQSEHYAVQYAKSQDYEGFYEEEMSFRNLMMYPPAGNLLGVQIQGSEEARVKKLSTHLSELIDNLKSNEEISKIGPADASLSKKCDLYRRVIYIKSREYNHLIDIKDAIEKDVAELKLTKETVMFDFNPMNGF